MTTEQAPVHSSRGIPIAAGLILSASGILLVVSQQIVELLPLRLRFLSIGGPAFFAAGLVILLRGFAWGTSTVVLGVMRMAGLSMLVIGTGPWLYFRYLSKAPGNEADGMLFTLLFVFVGLPGLVLALAGLFSNPSNSPKGSSDG